MKNLDTIRVRYKMNGGKKYSQFFECMYACQFIMKNSAPLGFITSFTCISFLLPNYSWNARRTTVVQNLPFFFGFLHLIYIHLVELPGWGIGPSHSFLPAHDIYTEICSIQARPSWDSNTRHHCLSGRRQYNLYTTRPLWSGPVANHTSRKVPLEKLTVAQIANNSCYQRTDAFVRKNENTVLAPWRNVFTCSCRYHEQFPEAVHDSRQSLQVRPPSYVSASSANKSQTAAASTTSSRRLLHRTTD
jgi:hypothetical protein